MQSALFAIGAFALLAGAVSVLASVILLVRLVKALTGLLTTVTHTMCASSNPTGYLVAREVMEGPKAKPEGDKPPDPLVIE